MTTVTELIRTHANEPGVKVVDPFNRKHTFTGAVKPCETDKSGTYVHVGSDCWHRDTDLIVIR